MAEEEKLSVVKSKRKVGKLAAITKANELAAYTIRICSNEKHFPKRYRWCITSKIVESSLEINNLANKANSVYVHDREDYLLRKRLQTMALAETYSLLSMIDIGFRTFGIDGERVRHWTGLVLEVQNLLRNWCRNDRRRYENLG